MVDRDDGLLLVEVVVVGVVTVVVVREVLK
jgi:hypothetical protein